MDAELGDAVAVLPWVREGATDTGRDALRSLERIASLDRGLARSTTALDWFAGRMTAEERSALSALEELAAADIALAVRTAGATSLWSPRLVANSLRPLAWFRARSPQRFEVLAAKPWFADGLSRQDAALLATLRVAVEWWPDLYDELVEAHYAESAAVDAPLAGAVNVWLFGNKPIEPPGHLLDQFVQAVSTSESFMGEPFPDRDFVVLVAYDHPLRSNYNFGSHVVIAQSTERPRLGPHTVFHETAHHYMYGGLAGNWSFEGGANFIATMGLAQLGVRDLDEWPLRVARSVRDGCVFDPGFGVLQDLIDYDRDARALHSCNYSFGELFLHRLREVMGRDAIGAAFGEIYRTGRETRRFLSEETLYQIFLKNTPAGRRESVESVYRELHGGPFVAGFENVGPAPAIPDALRSELPQWAGSPPDNVHVAALAAIVKVWELDSRLGLSLAQAAWLADGADHGEAIALNALYETAAADLQLAVRMANYAWVRDGVAFWERKALEAVSRLARHNPGAAGRVARYPWMADGATNEERLLLEFMADVSVAAGGGAAPGAEWMADGLTDAERQLLVPLRKLLVQDAAYCLDVLALPWVAGGPTDFGAEARAVRGLTLLVEADRPLANDVIRLEWVRDGLHHPFEDGALSRIGAIARANVQDAERIAASGWFRDGIDLDDLLRLEDYSSG